MSKAEDKFYTEVIEIEEGHNQVAKILEGQQDNGSLVWMALGELHALSQFRKELSNTTIRDMMQWHKDNLAQWLEDIGDTAFSLEE